MEIKHIESSDLLSKAQNFLSEMLLRYKDGDILLMLSGGSALSLIDSLPENIDWGRVTLTVLDERYTHNDTESNFAQLLKKDSISFLSNTAHFIDPRPKRGETLEETSKRFEVELRAWGEEHSNGVILATMGVGEDGHTAGILPFPKEYELFAKLFNNKKIWVQGYEIDKQVNQYTKRITTTNTFLINQITEALVYIQGENKKEALSSLMSQTDNLAVTPSGIIKNMKTATIVTDTHL